MASETDINVEELASNTDQTQPKKELPQNCFVKVLKKACTQRHGKETIQNSWRGVLAEFMGMIFVVLIGCGASAASEYFIEDPVSKLIFTAGTGGYTIYILVASLLKISGGHVNPAVTVGIVTTRTIGFIKAFVYVVAQVLGSVTAAAILWALTPTSFRHSFCVTRRNPDTSIGQAFGLELLCTYLFMLPGFTTGLGKHVWGHKAWITVGFAVYLGILVAAPFSGASLNPAKSFAPQLFVGFTSDHWIHWIACPLGSALAGVTWGILEYGRNTYMKKQRYTFDLEEKKRSVGCYIRFRDAVKPAVWVGAGAEFLAVFMLVFWGRGTLIATLALNPTLTPSHVVAVSIAKGMAYAVVTYSFLYFSGAHANSAVTIALFFTKHVGFFRALVYILSQLLGGIFGAGILWIVIPEAYRANLGFPLLGRDISLAQAWGWEVIFSGLLVFCYYAMLLEPYRRSHGRMGPLGIGFAVIAINFAGTALTGCGLNPSEIFGIALITNQSVNWSVVWIYIVGPITGALIIGSVITLKVHSLPNDELC